MSFNFRGTFIAGLILPTFALAGWKYFDPTNQVHAPAKFSETGFYSNWTSKTVDASAHFYEVNTPLWSDHAHKYRWVIVPAGKKIQFNPEDDYWDYPDSTVFVKLFKHSVTDPKDTTDLIWWETRVLVNKENEDKADIWYGFSYKWQPDGSEAHLLNDDSTDEARNVALTFYPQGKGAGKPSKLRKWHYPTQGQCMQCHRTDAFDNEHGRSILGFFTPQINRPTRVNPTLNQITQFFTAGILQWKNKGARIPTPDEINGFPRWAGLNETTVDLDKRARSYIGANCSGCHGTRGNVFGAAMVRWNYDFTLAKPETSFSDIFTTRQFGPNQEISRLLYPKKPDSSALLYRQKQRLSYDYDVKMWQQDTSSSRPMQPPLSYGGILADAMPPYGFVMEEDTAATHLLAEWIKNYDESFVSIRRHVQRKNVSQPYVQGHTLLVPEGHMERVALYDLSGREITIQKITNSSYALPTSIRPGLYVIRVGRLSYTRLMD